MPKDPGSPRSKRRSRPPVPRLALAFAALILAGCTQDLGSLDVPWSIGTSTAKARSGAPAAEEPSDCDELAGPPYDVSLGKPARPPTYAPPRFKTLPDVTLPVEATAKLNQIDDAFFKKTGKHIVITSGTRDAALQAKAMYKMIRLGGDIVRLYKNKEAAHEVRRAYDKNAGKPADTVIEAMYDVLKEQIDRGVFISKHLRAGAVDVRNLTMSPVQKRAFVKIANDVGGVSVLAETKPPHYHLQLD